MESFEDRQILETIDENYYRVESIQDPDPLHTSTRPELNLLPERDTEQWFKRAGVPKDDNYQYANK